MPDPRKTLGALGEDAAAALLKREGYALIARNWTCPRGEIDLIAAEGEVLCFVEVKTRTSDDVAPPEASVTRRKQAKLRALAAAYLRRNRAGKARCRFDVVSVLQPENGPRQLTLIRDAF